MHGGTKEGGGRISYDTVAAGPFSPVSLFPSPVACLADAHARPSSTQVTANSCEKNSSKSSFQQLSVLPSERLWSHKPHLRRVWLAQVAWQRKGDDHCCCSNFKYELFIKAGTSHVRTGPKKKKKKKSRPGTHRVPAMFVPLMSCDLARARANGLAYSRCPANTNDLATPLD